MDDVIYLLSTSVAKDDYGIWRGTPSKKMVYCKVNSVTRAEFFDGGRNGLNPEYRMDIFFGDYSGETSLLFHDEPYAIYRTYKASNDTLELYVERKGGTNGIEVEEENGEPEG